MAISDINDHYCWYVYSLRKGERVINSNGYTRYKGQRLNRMAVYEVYIRLLYVMVVHELADTVRPTLN